MARSLFVMVCDDSTVTEKAKSWAKENNISLACYSSGQWSGGLEDQNFRNSLKTEEGWLKAGSTVVSQGGKVVPFPGTGDFSGTMGGFGGNKTGTGTTNMSGDKRVATMDELESQAIQNAIFEYKGNLTEAARALGIGRATLYRKVKQYNIDPSAARNKNTKAA